MAGPAAQAAAEASRRPSPQVQNGETRRRMLRADCAFFASEVLGIEIGDHHQEWSELIRKHDRISVLAARGHGKSGFWSYAYPLWRSWRTAGNLGLIVSDTEGQVGEFFRIIKEGKSFRDKDGLLWKLPAVADIPFMLEEGMLPKDWERTWTESRISFANRSRFEGKTFGKRFRGRHVLWMVIDDGIGDDAAYSERAREKDWDFFTRALAPMVLPGGQIVDAGTPLHADDIHGRLAKVDEYVQRKYPAIRIENGREVALWSELRPLKWLRAKEREIGSLAFGQEYMLQPATSEASLFPLRLFMRRPEVLDHTLSVNITLDEIKARGWSVFFGVDVAQSAEVGADNFVICVMAVDDLGNRFVINMLAEKGMPFHAQLAAIEDWAARYEPDMIYIEANASQRIYGDELIRTTDLPIGKYVTSAAGKNSLESGVPGLRPLIENGKLRFARGDAESIQITDPLIAELGCFAWVDGKLQGVGAHDDRVMALFLCDQAVRATRRFTLWTADDNAEAEDAALEDDDVFAPSEPLPPLPDDGPGPDFVDVDEVPAAPPPEPAPVVKPPPRPKPGAPRLAAPVFTRAELDEDDLDDEPAPRRPARKAPPRSAASALVQACGGHADEAACAIANDLPGERQLWIEGWNAMMGSGDMPPAVAAAVRKHGHRDVRGVLGVLLGIQV